RTEAARRVAYCSSEFPPESIRMMITATRYCCSSAAVTMETPARRSEPNWPANRLRPSFKIRGTPPATRAANNGTSVRNSKCAPRHKAVTAAINVSGEKLRNRVGGPNEGLRRVDTAVFTVISFCGIRTVKNKRKSPGVYCGGRVLFHRHANRFIEESWNRTTHHHLKSNA